MKLVLEKGDRVRLKSEEDLLQLDATFFTYDRRELASKAFSRATGTVHSTLGAGRDFFFLPDVPVGEFGSEASIAYNIPYEAVDFSRLVSSVQALTDFLKAAGFTVTVDSFTGERIFVLSDGSREIIYSSATKRCSYVPSEFVNISRECGTWEDVQKIVDCVNFLFKKDFKLL